MASKTVDQLQRLDAEIRATWDVLYAEFAANQELWSQNLVYEETTSQDFITLEWLHDILGPRARHTGERPSFRNLRGESHVIYLQSFGDGITVTHKEWFADRMNMITGRVAGAVAYLARHVQDLIIDRLRLGDTSAVVTWDGENYFSNSHPKGGTTFDNLLSGALSSTTFQAARTAMRRFPSDEGASIPLNIMPTHLVVPVDIEVTAKELMKNTFVPGGAGEGENQLRGMAEVVTDARFTDVDDWYLIANQHTPKPFVVVRHSDKGQPTLYTRGLDPSEDAFEREVIEWWYRYDMTLQPTKPEYALKVIAP